MKNETFSIRTNNNKHMNGIKGAYRFHNIEELKDEISRRGLDQFIAVQLDDREVEFYPWGEDRFLQVAEECDMTLAYCWYKEHDDEGNEESHPLSNYIPGSIRDDFDFGSIVLLNCADTLSTIEEMRDEDGEIPENNCLDGGWYALRLRLSLGGTFIMVPEYLYRRTKTDFRLSGARQHDYVDPRNRDYQQQMEDVVTEYLQNLGCYLFKRPKQPDMKEEEFPVTASVVIPVRNRAATVGEAVMSALSQETDFLFNVIVVDNGSTDGTTRILRDIKDPRLKVIEMSGKEGLGIGGCWNVAITDTSCGRFAVQLDSDDLYSGPDTLQTIVDCFMRERCAMVVGSYLMTDFDKNPIPPGIIDHKEWTDDNGRNNLLRINGIGAPRAFYTPVLRQILFPNVSYGEDYAVALRISREWKIGRIWEPIYLCRRWGGNSDAALPPEKVNEHNKYKDFLRSIEMLSRIDRGTDGFTSFTTEEDL